MQGKKLLKLKKMLSHASNVKTIITENEVEAFFIRSKPYKNRNA